jgi:hypothetical protein
VSELHHPGSIICGRYRGLYAYTGIDTCTREAQVVLLPGLTGHDAQKALDTVMAYLGCCEVLQAYGGKELMGEFEERFRCYAERRRVSRP